VEVPVEGDEANEVHDPVFPSRAKEVVTHNIGETHPFTNFVGPVRQGVEPIIDQLQSGLDEAGSLLQASDPFILDKHRNRELPRSTDKERFPGQVTLATHPATALFVEVALRVEPLIDADMLLTPSQPEDRHQRRNQTKRSVRR
jgi:hypothetical protein